MNSKQLKLALLSLVILLTTNVSIFSQVNNDNEKARFKFKKSDKINSIGIPEVCDIKRIKPGERLSGPGMRNTCYVLKSVKHNVEGNAYVILTDHTEKEYLNALKSLAKYRDGVIIKTTDLAKLYQQERELKSIKNKLKSVNVKYIALAPRIGSYTENMILNFYELISNLDEDPFLDVYPGLLLASNPKSFKELINRSINYSAKSESEVTPMVCSMVPNNRELRSLQKNGILHNMFIEYGLNVPVLNIYSDKAGGAPDLIASKMYRLDFKHKEFLKKLPDDIKNSFKSSSMLVFHGHGLPGASCGISTEAIPEKIGADIVLMGSCFSASTQTSDITPVRISPDGYKVVPKKSFALDLIDKGATVVMGHMRLNQGFPRLFPVLENFMDGRSVGLAYQELVNTSLSLGKFDNKNLVLREKPKKPRRIKQNGLLYILFGDPALKPLNKMTRK